MKYRLIITKDVEKKLKKMGPNVASLIFKWIKKNILEVDDPRLHGKELLYGLKGYWRYRIGDYRLIVDINDSELVIITIDVGHRKDIYN